MLNKVGTTFLVLSGLFLKHFVEKDCGYDR